MLMVDCSQSCHLSTRCFCSTHPMVTGRYLDFPLWAHSHVIRGEEMSELRDKLISLLLLIYCPITCVRQGGDQATLLSCSREKSGHLQVYVFFPGQVTNLAVCPGNLQNWMNRNINLLAGKIYCMYFNCILGCFPELNFNKLYCCK